MEYKVDREIAWDREQNEGRMLKGVMGIVLRHQPPEAEWTRDEYVAIADVLGNDAEARLVEWRYRATEQVASLSDEERRKLAWTGSDVVIDINQFRATKVDSPAAE